MEEKRTLIETFLPVEEISAEAKKEKRGMAKPPTFELHYWWTRKPLVVSRATVLGTLLPYNFDNNEFKHLLGLHRDKRAHNYDLNSGTIKKLEKKYLDMWDTKTPTILDPFGGGGSIPFEALRVNSNVISNDYNPVAHLIQKATLEYPISFKETLFKDVEKGLKWVFNKTKAEMSEFYPKHDGKDVAAYIYSWVVPCPECGFKNPLVGQWWLLKKGKKKIYLDPNIENNKLKLSIKSGDKAPLGNVTRGKAKCLNCGTTISNEHIRKEIQAKEEEKLLAVVLLGKNGKEYELPNETDINGFEKSKNYLKENMESLIKEDLIPLEEMPLGDIAAGKYLKYWYKIFNPRQLILFSFLIRNIRNYIDELNYEENYKIAIATYLSFILGKHIDYNCRSTTWLRSIEAISHSLALRRPSMLWDHSEINPFIKISGSLLGINKAILKGIKYSSEKLKYQRDVEIHNTSITEFKSQTQIIITDPPYFNDVQYAELSELFYVLERKVLKNLINLPQEVPKSEDLSVGRHRSDESFEHLFNIACQKMNLMLSNDGILVMYFAHSSVKAWDFVVTALRNANFRITATWPIHTESPVNPLSMGKASIMSSIIIVGRKRKGDRIGYIEEIKSEMESNLKIRLKEFWSYGLRGSDITVAAMGAALNILTQYSEIKSYTGEMTVKDILELVEVYVVEYILEKFLKNSESLDSHTRFYLYCRLSELDGMSFDTANLISKSLNIDLKSLESSGNISSITKGSKKGIKILKFDERENIEVKNIIDAVQLSMLSYDKGGMKEFESTLANTPYSKREVYNILESFKHLNSRDPEKQIALQILGKSTDFIPEKGQTTLD